MMVVMSMMSMSDDEDGEDGVYAFIEWVCYILIDTSHECLPFNDDNVKVTTYLPI